SSSFGHFCLGNDENIGRVLDSIQSGEIQPRKLLRLELMVNGSTLPELVLNEVLVTHSNPAATSRYFLEMNNIREEQRSSGMWIGTPAGSTGSLRSAGCPVMDITAQQYQYIVRVPCIRPGEKWQLLRGVLGPDTETQIVSQMRTGRLYIDGQHIDYDFGLGDELIIRPSKIHLNAFIDDHVNEIFK